MKILVIGILNKTQQQQIRFIVVICIIIYKIKKNKLLDDKESEIEALLYRPFDCSNITTTTTLSGFTSSKQQYQQLHQALIAESEEELFGRLVARDLVRLPANLRPLARLKIQELLYHFSIGHIPEMH